MFRKSIGREKNNAHVQVEWTFDWDETFGFCKGNLYHSSTKEDRFGSSCLKRMARWDESASKNYHFTREREHIQSTMVMLITGWERRTRYRLIRNLLIRERGLRRKPVLARNL